MRTRISSRLLNADAQELYKRINTLRASHATVAEQPAPTLRRYLTRSHAPLPRKDASSAGARGISRSSSVRGQPVDFGGQSVEAKGVDEVPGQQTEAALEETEDVLMMDKLMRSVRLTSDPAFHSIVPMRSPALWSETLLSDMSRETDSDSGAPTKKADPPPPRSMGDSYSEIVLQFGSSPELLEQYTNASGGIRTGKLMEHLDSLAGSIAYKHMLGPSVQTLGRINERGFYIVTASVDRLDMLAQLDPKRDLRLSGQVIYTGRSSMEVAVRMESVPAGQAHSASAKSGHLDETTVMLGRFSMVCRDAHTHKARPVSSLVPRTSEEQALFTIGEKIKNRRASLALRSLARVPPNPEEARALHAFWLACGREGADAAGVEAAQGEKATPEALTGMERVWMGDTRIEKCMVMFPQERNVHSKVFGGYLMRLAYEVSYSQQNFRYHQVRRCSCSLDLPMQAFLRVAMCASCHWTG
ncbi:hypothetical protein HGRIS_006809 [Hohenbuehelia grisea]|uniref:HotDog ACOT-type domain-containing protein n=1 Tax=Hohenbuehelia grisea TaxID=104357 RepID=A0ABR3JAG1_9AGAR